MSTVKFDKWENSDGTENYKCRAWVNFNGTGTVAIRASGNVSSITDNGTGQYTVNFTSAMPDANYSCAVSSSAINWISDVSYNPEIYTTSSVKIKTSNSSVSIVDAGLCSVAIFR